MRTPPPPPPHEKSEQGSGSRRALTNGGFAARVRAALDACFGASLAALVLALAAFASAPAAAQTISIAADCIVPGSTMSSCGASGDRDTTWPGLQVDEGDTFEIRVSSSDGDSFGFRFTVAGDGYASSDIQHRNGSTSVIGLGLLSTYDSTASDVPSEAWVSYDVKSDNVAEGDETITWTLTNVIQGSINLGGGRFHTIPITHTIGTPSSVTVTIRGTDAAPDFGTGSVPAKSFTRNTAITEFQVPAATGGNGAITYAVSGLPAGLVFDASGTDTNGCPGTEPREICGTPTGSGGTVTVTARDADSNTASTDEDTLTFSVSVTSGVTLASNPSPLTEANLNGATLTVTLPSGTTFSSGVSASGFAFVTSPTLAGLSISNVTGGASGTRTATLTLATGTGYGFNTPATLAVRVLAAAHSGSTALTSATLPVSPTPGITLSRESLALEEDPGTINANRGTYTIVPDSPPTGCAGIGFAPASDNADVTVSPSSLQFNNSNWTTPKTFTVTAAQDNDGTHDTATITHSVIINCDAAGYPTSLTLPSLTVNVNDDDVPTVTLALSASSIAESGASNVSTVTATLNRTSGAATEVTVAAAPGAGTDFTQTGTRLTIAAGQTTSTGTVTLTAADNAADAPDKTVTVSGTATNAQGITQPTNVTLTITDDDALPTVTLALSATAVTEAGGQATVTAMLSHPSSEAVTLTVSAAAVSPAVPGDFSLSATPTLLMPAGQPASTGTVTLTAVNNAVDAADKTVTVSATAAGGRGVANPSAVTLTLTDNDTAGITADPTSGLRTSEAGGTAAFRVTLDSEPTGAVVLDVASSDTTEGTVMPSALTFAAADWNTDQTVTLTGQDDMPTAMNPNPSSGTRPYTVTLTVNTTATQDATYDALSAVTVNAQNADDEYGLTPGTVTGQATEAGGTAAFAVKLNTQPGANVIVTVASQDTSEGLASPSSLTFTTTDWNTEQTVTVTGQNDDVDDGTVTWTVRLTAASSDTNYNTLTENVSVTTTDDDAAPTVTLAAAPASIAENGGVATVTATLSHASGAATTVTVTAGTGYTVGTDAVLVIPAEATAAPADVATVQAADDAVHQGSAGRDVTVTATVANARATADSTTMAVTGAALRLTDDETLPTVALALSSASVTEEGGVSTVTATLSGASDEAVTVTVAAAAGTGAVGADFDLSTARTLTIAAGQTASTGTVTVTANGNAVDSPDKSVTVSGTVTGGHGVAVPATVTLTLTDDEALPTVALGLAPTSITESGGVSTVTATLSGASGEAVVVTVGAAAGTGAVAADFTLSGTMLTIDAGQTGSTGLVTVTANGNTVDAPDKTVTVSGTATGGNGVANPAAVTLTLTDDEMVPTVTLGLSPTAITESGGVSTVTAGLNRASSAAVVVTVGAVAGTGAVAADFTLSGTMLTIAAGQTESTGLVTVTANGNDVDAANKSVTVSGTATGGNGVAAPANVTLTLTDDDVRSVTLGGSVSMNALVVPEQGSATYTVALATEPTGTVTVSPGFATGGDTDLTLNPAAPVLTFDATTWQTAQTVTVEAADDADAAAGTATLEHTVSGADYNGLTVAGVTVTESDNETPTLSIAGAAVAEGAAGASTSLTFTVTLSPAGTVPVTVAYADAGTGTATSGTDYDPLAAGTLTFAAGTTTHTITVTVRGDAVDEANETIAVTLSNAMPSPGSAIGTGTAAGTITDDDERGVTVSAAASGLGVTEGSTAAYTVRLTSQPTGRVTVAVGGTTSTVTVDVAAAAGNQTAVTFTASTWATARPVTVTAGEDGNSQSETVTLTHAVSGADYGANTVPAAAVTVTVTDNDTPGLAVSPTTLTVTEEQQATYTVRLHTQPSANVAVAVASGAPAVAMVAPSTLTFTATDWATAQPVTVTGTADADATTNEQATVTHTPSGASEYTGLAPAQRPSVTVTVTDDERQGVTVSAAGSGLPVTEGATATYTVVLTAAPVGGAVTVTVSGTTSTVTADVAAAAGNQTALTFTATDWATAQPVTVTAGEDENSGGETVTLTHGVAGADYGSVTVGSVTVRVTDNDTPALVMTRTRPLRAWTRGRWH